MMGTHDLDPYVPTEQLKRVCVAGAHALCPFCAAILGPVPQPGDSVQVLTGLFSGQIATVSPMTGRRQGEIYLRFGQDPDGDLFVLSLNRELAQRLPGLGRPEWFPPLRLPDAGDLHTEVLRFAASHRWADGEQFDWRWFYGFVGFVWQRRLPLEPGECGEILSRHGVPVEHLLTTLLPFYEHGRSLLVTIIGRKPIKKNRADYKRGSGARSRSTSSKELSGNN